MSQISLGAIISDVLKERNVENEASIKQCRRNFTKLIEKLGGNIDDLKNCQNSIRFNEDEVPFIKFLILKIFLSSNNAINNFLSSKDKDITPEMVEEFIDQVANEFCDSENSEEKEKMITYLSDIFMLSHVRIVKECHELVDHYANELYYLPRSLKLLYLQNLKNELCCITASQLMQVAQKIKEISEYIELCKDGEKEVDCIYDGFSIDIQTEYIQRDQEILRALQEDEDLRAYVEKKIGKKVEEIFNYRALTDFTVIFKETDANGQKH